MKQDQNRIELRINTAEYDECVLYANGGTRVLPGSLLVFADGNVSNSRDPVRPNRGYASFDYEPKLSAKVYSSTGVVDGYMMNPETGVVDRDTNWGPYTRYQFEVEESESEADILEAYAGAFGEDETPSIDLLKQKLAVPGSIDRFPCAVVLENALFGKSLSHESPAGELVLCRYLTASNELLLRAVSGQYWYGDIVYAVQTKNNGIWVASESTLASGISSGVLEDSAALGMKVGICQEDYKITPVMCRIVDIAEPEDPTGYIPANEAVSDEQAGGRIGISAIPYDLNAFYDSNVSSSRYFSGALLNLIKVRTTAFYASTAPLPTIDGVEVSPVGGLGYNGTARTDLGSIVTVTGTDPTADILSYSLQGAGEVKNAGSYVVVVRVQRQGYQTLTRRVTVNIAKAALSVSGSTVADKEQDDTTTAVVTLGTVSGIFGADDVVVTPSASFPSSDVGEYTVTIDYVISGSAAKNYIAPDSTTDTASITEKTTPGPNPTGDEELDGVSVSYSSLGDTITYDGVDRPISDFFEFTGTESGDDINYYVDGTLFGGEVPTVKLPGAYSVRITVDREGYAQFTETLPVTINKAHVTVTGSTAQSKAYDKSTYATLNLGTVSGLVAGDDATLGYSAAFASSLPGVQDVSVTYSLGGADIGNYILDTVNETLSAEITTREFAITGTEIKEKVYDGTSAAEVVVGSVTGLIEGDDVTITGSAIFHTVTVGNYNITVHYTLTGADADKYYAPNQTRPTRIKPKQLTISGTTVEDKTYDGTVDAEIIVGMLSGLVGSDTVTLTAAGSFSSADVGSYDIEISYSISDGESRNYLAPITETVPAEILPAMITGVNVVSGNVNAGDPLNIQVTGTQAGDTVTYLYGGNATDTLPVITEPGNYTVIVKVARPNHRDWSKSVSFMVIDTSAPPAVSYHYIPTTDGHENSATTRGINLLLMPDDETVVIPEQIPLSSITVDGDAFINTDAEYLEVVNGNAYLPVQMIKKASGDYYINIKIDLDNSDTEVKTIPAYLMTGYYGCYPCQLGGLDAPTEAQIHGMEGKNVFVGPKEDNVTDGVVECRFGINIHDWDKEVAANGITGDDADITENAQGGGKVFFITCWDGTDVTSIMSGPIEQLGAFKPWTVTLDGIQYSGVISRETQYVTGSSVFDVHLS